MALPQLNREQLSRVFGGDIAVIRAYEALQSGMQFTPDIIESLEAGVAEAMSVAQAALFSRDVQVPPPAVDSSAQILSSQIFGA